MGVEASVIVTLEGEIIDTESGSVIVEIDDTHPNNLDDDGNVKSSFLPEDNPVILVHLDPSLRVEKVKCTDGSVSSIGSNIVRSRSFDALFTSIETAIDIGYYGVTDSTFDFKWFGNEADPHLVNNELIATEGVFPAYTEGNFEVTFDHQYQLTPPPMTLVDDEVYQIFIVIYVRRVS